VDRWAVVERQTENVSRTNDEYERHNRAGRRADLFLLEYLVSVILGFLLTIYCLLSFPALLLYLVSAKLGIEPVDYRELAVCLLDPSHSPQGQAELVVRVRAVGGKRYGIR
jgi:hypothetical protein